MESKPSYEELEQRVLQLEQENYTLQEQAVRDPLTGLYNRQFYTNNIADILQENKLGGVLFLDINDFKYLNDNFGHKQGDKILQDLSKIIQSSIKGTDYAIRWGGEELIVILSNANEDTGKAVIGRINSKLDKYNQFNRMEGIDKKGKHICYDLAVAAGYDYRKCGTVDDMDELIDIADAKMYVDKERQKA
ncbi:MAG: GGDEF domain-containing protein [Nanoarchaeota archaeon]|nr:GGDEF domain-containing protein [Nanoarchaeota archaeon]MBU1321919.1 GGDEF domain-containing protein [Nanoarchaeota archaeon]MBU1597612.1 GGDEF domain-containing protein [Nanoarchaeota archaeon]MBU2440980.1 GGDEF domain-containing protein [Nanoarchaeota archaeon]